MKKPRRNFELKMLKNELEDSNSLLQMCCSKLRKNSLFLSLSRKIMVVIGGEWWWVGGLYRRDTWSKQGKRHGSGDDDEVVVKS